MFTSSCFAFALDNTKIAALSAALYSFLTASSASLKLSCDVRSPFFSTSAASSFLSILGASTFGCSTLPVYSFGASAFAGSTTAPACTPVYSFGASTLVCFL